MCYSSSTPHVHSMPPRSSAWAVQCLIDAIGFLHAILLEEFDCICLLFRENHGLHNLHRSWVWVGASAGVGGKIPTLPETLTCRFLFFLSLLLSSISSISDSTASTVLLLLTFSDNNKLPSPHGPQSSNILALHCLFPHGLSCVKRLQVAK